MKRILLAVSSLMMVMPAAQAKSAVETYSDIGAIAIPALAAGYAWQQDDQEGLKQFGYSLASTIATSEGLKYSVDSTRPNGKPHSFPSGHTALAFSGASYVQMRYGWEYGAPAYVVAGTVGWSRVSSNNHYWRDVFAGALIASGFSYLFTTPKEQKLAFYPLLMDNNTTGIGMQLVY